MTQLGLDENKAIFTLGSLVYPKEMLRSQYTLDEYLGSTTKWSQAVKQFHDALYNFSIDKT